MPTEITPALAAAGLSQILLLLAGLGVLWYFQFGPAGRIRARGPHPLTAWSVSVTDFLVAGLIVIGGALGFQIALNSLFKSIDPDLTPTGDFWLLAMGAAFQFGLLAGALIGGAFLKSRTLPAPPDPVSRVPVMLADQPSALQPSAFGFGPVSRVPVMLAGAATFAAALPLITAVNLPWVFLLESLGFSTDKQELVDVFRNAESPAVVALIVVLAVVVAPLTEELIFRAGLFRYLRTRAPRWVALLVPAMIFGSLHGNLVAFLPLVALGIVFALAYERTGRIAVPIIAHGLFNLNTLLLLAAGVEV